MKKLAILALALITFQANAQDNSSEKRQENKKERMEKRMKLEPKEMAELKTKKMTLHLDLTEAQQTKVMALNLENAKQRKEHFKKHADKKDDSEKAKPSKEEKLKRMNAKLDAQIATKKQMKDILNADQYEKWEKSELKRNHGRKHNKKGERKHGKGEKNSTETDE